MKYPKKQSSTKKSWILIGLTVSCIISVTVLFTKTTPLLAQRKESVEKTESNTMNQELDSSITNSLGVEIQASNLGRALDPIENESGLKVTPKVLKVQQNESFPDLYSEDDLKLLFSKQVIPHSEYGATYEYVDEQGEPTQFSSEQVGFQIIYVKVTENYSETSVQVPVPVTVTDIGTSLLLGNKVALQIEHINGKIILYPEETANKTEEELKQLVKEKSEVYAWSMENGTDVSTNVTKTTISTTSVGTYKADFEITMRVGVEEKKASVQKNVIVFGANPKPFAIRENEYLDVSGESDNLFGKFQTVEDTQASSLMYELVGETGDPLGEYDTTNVGFGWAYVKMTDYIYPSISTIIKVPINVTNDDTTALLKNKVMVQSSAETLFYPDEIAGKSNEELIELIRSRAEVTAWNMSTGEMIPATFTETNMVNNLVGTYNTTIQVELNGEIATTTRNLIVFGANLKAPYYFNVMQGESLDMGENAQNIFSKYQTTFGNDAFDASFEWIDEYGDPTETNDFDSSEVGFQWGYIRMTDIGNPEISTVIPIPITVTLDKQTVIVESKAGLSIENNKPFISSEFQDKTDQEINQLLTQRLSPTAWNLTSGEKLEVKITQTAIADSGVGQEEVTARITLNNEQVTYNLNIFIFPGQIFEDEDIDTWSNIYLGDYEVITNPINGSQMGFPKRGISTSTEDEAEHGFIIKDENGVGYVFGHGEGRVSDIPGVNNKVLYGDAWFPDFGLGQERINSNLTSSYYLRKGNKLKQILIDEKNEIVYEYNLSLNRNLNFSIRLNMYNVADTMKKFSMLESVDTDYYTDEVPIYALGNSSGFYMEPPSSGSRFSIKLKDSNGNWLSDYTKYAVIHYSNLFKNNFLDNFSGDGAESMNYSQDDVIFDEGDSAYQLGAPWKNIKPGKALEVGYEIFAGAEIPYMQIKANPEIFNVYEDHNADFDTKYKLSKIPKAGNRGTIYVTYPSGKEVTTRFTANANKEFNGKLNIPRTELPQKLNEEPGTIKSYDTGLLAINETAGDFQGLSSQDYSVQVKVYNLGAKPVPQIIQKGDDLKKKASELIQDAVILPGHTASYEYEGDMPDTSVVGLTSVSVRMTDTNQPEKTTLIKVPIQVVDEPPPANGIYLIANDFSSSGEVFQELTESERDKLILKKSEAIAWDTETGSIDKIKLSVESTTLPSNPEQGSYKATIKATKGPETTKKTIMIDIQSNQKVNVEFVDEKGESLHDKITFDKTIGTTIDLTEEKEVQKALESIQAKNYQLVKKPDNETKIPVTSEESTVQYQFKGMLFIQSSPNFLNFGRKSLGIPFIKVEKAKYDKPLIVWDNRKNGGAWNLTATLKKPLTSQEDQSKVLPSAIRYKISDSETVTLSENTTQSIAERTHVSKGQYNVSNEWDKNESGLLLEVPSGEVLQPGGYRATILWQVEQTP
ncbi:hypothetical protein IGJ02_002257 [Enterococcus sp. DIV0724b]|uniref:MucBP domain-containing protein n=1 Tax=Enterococcus sp. DIV0724b TaxID=2774694 RepID=UPI003D2FE2E1